MNPYNNISTSCIISYLDTYRGNTEIYGVFEKNHIGRGVSRAQYDIFFKDPHIFPYFDSLKSTYHEFILFTLSFRAV